MADPVTVALIGLAGGVLGGLIGVAGGVIGARTAASAAAEHEQSAWLRDTRLQVYGRLDGAVADIVQAVQDAGETPTRRHTDIFPRYSSAVDAFATAANEAVLICEPTLYGLLGELNAITDKITLAFLDDSKWPADPAETLKPGRATWEPRATLEPIAEAVTDAIRAELGRPPLPPLAVDR